MNQKDESEVKRKPVCVRFTEKDYKALVKLAKDNGMKPADWLRNQSSQKPITSMEQERLVLERRLVAIREETLTEFNRIGKNFNQLVRAASAAVLTGDAIDTVEIKRVCTALLDIAGRIDSDYK